MSLILQFEEGLYKKIGDVYSCKNVSYLTKEGDQFNTRVQIGFSSIYVDRYIFDISYNSRYVTRIDLSDYLSLEDQIKTSEINMIPIRLAFQSDDPDYVYVMGEGECDNSGNRTVYAINFSPIHCFENETWCLGEHYRKIVTKLSCSHTPSSITLLNSLYPYLLFDDQPMTKQINCYRADRYYDQPIACLSQAFPVNRSNLVTYPKSEYEMYLQVKYFDNHTKADRYSAFVVDTLTGICTELSRDETHTHCPMVGPQVYSCPHYTVIGQDLPFSPVTQPQVYMFQGGRLITYGTAKGVFLRSPKFPSGIILEDSENFCKDLTHSSPIVILDSGNRIVIIMCTNGQYSMQIYLLYEDRYIIIRSIDKDCLSLTEGGKQSLLNIFSPGEVHFLPVHVNVSKNDTDKELPPPPDSHHDEIVILITVLVSIFVIVLVCILTVAILVIVYCKKCKYQRYNLVTAQRGKNRSVLASRQTMSLNPLISKVEDPEIDTLPPDGNRSTKQSHHQASNPRKEDRSPRLICASDSDSEVNNEECQPIPNESNLTQDASPVASPSPQFAVSKVLDTSACIQKNGGFKRSTKPKPQPTPVKQQVSASPLIEFPEPLPHPDFIKPKAVATGGNITASTAGNEMDKENDNDEKEELVAPLRVKTFASANQSTENSSKYDLSRTTSYACIHFF